MIFNAIRNVKLKGIFVLVMFFLVSVVGMFSVVKPSYAAGVFTATGSLNYGRSGHSATLLPNGKVLMVGGSTYVYTAELYDLVSGTFSTTGSLIKSRSYGNTETLLPNGKVLITGGINVDFHTTADAELYDYITGLFLPTGNMIHARAGHTATLLPNGKVLITGGDQDGVGGLSVAEIYDPITGIFSQTGNMTYVHVDHSATLLSDGKVLIAGGGPKVMELYDSNTGTFSLTGSMVDFRNTHTATLLSNGKVLIVGGYNNNTTGGLNTAEIYDPTLGTSTAIANLSQARYGQKAINLSTGNILIVGGSNDFGGGQLKSAELFNPTTNTFSQTGNMIYVRNNHTATLLSNGKVLVAGGGLKGASDNTLVVELYVDNSAPIVGAITVSTNPVKINTSVSVNATFTDSDTSDTHAAVWNWGDNTTSVGSVTENNGSGSVSESHIYTTAGTYIISVTVTDNHGASDTASYSSIVVYDHSAGFITGSGSFNSQAGAYASNPNVEGELKFNMQAKYKRNNTTPTGKVNLDFKKANFSFDSNSLQWLVINGGKAQLKGIGTINGSGNYIIFLTALDGSQTSGIDKIRIKITDSSNNIIYDNQPGDSDTADPIAPITKGSLKIHQ